MHRHGEDRRQKPTGPWAAFRGRGRRTRNRRADEHRQPYFVDRFTTSTLVVILLLLAFTLIDGVITLLLVAANCTETNPLMAYLLSKGAVPFIVGKYTLTALGLPFLLIFKNYYVFGRLFRVGYLLPCFVLMYLVLIAYQIYLLRLLQ
jgi:hypothetical protein